MLIEDIKKLTESQGLFGEPIEWNGLKLHPILMQDRVKFDDFVYIFEIDKTKLGSIEVIKMSYLHFLFELIKANDMVREAFIWMIERILKIEYNEKLKQANFPKGTVLSKSTDDGNQYCFINGYEIAFEVVNGKAKIYFGDKCLSATDFDEFKRIILYQNINGFDDTPMSEDIRRVVEKYYTLKNKGIVQPTLEDKMLAIISGSSETRETIKTMPCRQFERLFHTIVDKTDYEVTVPLIPHLKNPTIEHWIYKNEKDKWGEIFSSADDILKPTVAQ